MDPTVRHIHSGLPLVLVLSQSNPVHAYPSYFFKIRLNIICSSMPRSSDVLFPLGFPTKIL